MEMETAIPMMQAPGLRMGAPATQKFGGFGARALPVMSAMLVMLMAATAASAMPMMGALIAQDDHDGAGIFLETITFEAAAGPCAGTSGMPLQAVGAAGCTPAVAGRLAIQRPRTRH